MRTCAVSLKYEWYGPQEGPLGINGPADHVPRVEKVSATHQDGQCSTSRACDESRAGAFSCNTSLFVTWKVRFAVGVSHIIVSLVNGFAYTTVSHERSFIVIFPL